MYPHPQIPSFIIIDTLRKKILEFNGGQIWGGGSHKTQIGQGWWWLQIEGWREREREREFKLHQTLEIEEKYFTLKQEQPNTFGP